MKSIKVYFDYKSPFSYLAMEEIFKIQADFNIELIWMPWILNLSETYGDIGNRNSKQWNKVKNLYQQVRRVANKRGIIVKGPQKIYNGEAAALGSLYAIKHNKFKTYNDKVFIKFFKRELDIDSLDGISKVLEQCEVNSNEFVSFCKTEGESLLLEIRKSASDDRVFGVPSLVYQQELFWGSESFPFLRDILQGRRV